MFNVFKSAFISSAYGTVKIYEIDYTMLEQYYNRTDADWIPSLNDLSGMSLDGNISDVESEFQSYPIVFGGGYEAEVYTQSNGTHVYYGVSMDNYTLGEDAFGTYNLTTIMGGAEVVFELNQIIEHPGWDKAWLQYCRLYNAPRELVKKDKLSGTEGSDGSYARPDRLAAYVYWRTGNEAFVQPALRGVLGRRGLPDLQPEQVNGPDVLNPIDELPGVSTNTAAQSSLIAIQVLEMCGDKLPHDLPEQEDVVPFRQR